MLAILDRCRKFLRTKMLFDVVTPLLMLEAGIKSAIEQLFSVKRRTKNETKTFAVPSCHGDDRLNTPVF